MWTFYPPPQQRHQRSACTVITNRGGEWLCSYRQTKTTSVTGAILQADRGGLAEPD
jgi:phage tail protein X